MTDKRIVKIESILDSQIPSFLSTDSPLFKEFLTEYYRGLSYETGILDIANNLNSYKNISTYSKTLSKNCYLIENILTFDDEIEVNSVEGFPDKFGLLKIDNEIITYTGITQTGNTAKFTGCIRGFSGVSEINEGSDSNGLVFTSTDADEHISETPVYNLSLIFYTKLFEKFKNQYLPDFENREFSSKVDLDLILSRVSDFYLTKGTDISFQILFEVLYDDQITIIKPQDYLIKASDDGNIITKNILVEPLIGNFNPSDSIGKTIFQTLSNGNVASATIYNVEFRPTNEYFLYELSLDYESFIYEFETTKKTIILEKLPNSLIVDSTIGFPESGKLLIKIKNTDLTTNIDEYEYSGKTINQFLNIENLSESIKAGDEIIEDKLLEIMSDDNSTVYFRLLNVIQDFDFSKTNLSQINDGFYLSSFGDSFEDKSEFSSWIYNYPTYHQIQSVNENNIQLRDSVNFTVGEQIILIDESNNIESVTIIDVLSRNEIQINENSGKFRTKLIKKITKNNIDSENLSYIQNSYLNIDTNSLVVATSGVPAEININNLNQYSFIISGIGSVFTTRNLNNDANIEHNLLSGNRIFLDSRNVGIKTGQYFIKKINDNEVSLYQTTADLYLSFSKFSNDSKPVNIELPSLDNIIGISTVYEYKDSFNNYKNQLLLKEFKVEESLFKNKVTSTSPIYNIKQAYSAFS